MGTLFDHSFGLDEFQLRAGEVIARDENVLVAAPTGSGKTVTGEQAIAAALGRGGRAFYTTPIKALSNQKFRDLGAALGKERVGLMTGDHVINADAPVIVMTTEVLRNMLYASAPALEGLTWVVLDEVHFLSDAYRGAVWEEVLMHTPASVRFACLSATVSNATELGAWIESLRGRTTTVVEHRRPVELDVLYMVGDRTAEADHLVPMLIDGEPNPRGLRFDDPGGPRGSPRGRSGRHRGHGQRPRFRTPRRIEAVERLESEELLPAIWFVFSRRGCDEAAQRCFGGGIRLTTSGEAAQVRDIIEEATASLEDHDLDVLGYDQFLEAASRGIAAHHAGMVPAFREAVERCFTRGLIKVVFATETLALGINMPARSVVIDQLTKFTGEGHAMLTPAQFTQLTGRAGRRGIDERGAAVVMWSPWVGFSRAAELAASREFPLVSSFRPTYNMVANLVRRYREDQVHGVLGRSFAQFRADASIVELRSRLARLDEQRTGVLEELSRLEITAAEAAEFADLVRDEARLAASGGHGAAEVAASLAQLRPGDVLDRPSGNQSRLLLVIATSERKRGVRIDALTPRGKLVRLHSGDLDEPLRAVSHLELPVPHQPADTGFRKQAAARLRRVNPKRLRTPKVSRRDDPGLSAAREDVAAHRLSSHQERVRILELSAELARTERSMAQARRRIEGRDTDLLARFDAVRKVLTHFGHLEGWELTPAGRRLRSLFHESDLLTSLAIGEGLFDGLGACDAVALLSCITHEHRGGERPPPPRLPTRELQERFGALRELHRELVGIERFHQLPETPEPSAGFSQPARMWCGGASLGECMGEELSGGDFVRNARNLVDLATQVAQVTSGATSDGFSDAAEAIGRDVVLGGGAPQ